LHALWRVSVLGKGAWSLLPSSVCSAVAFALPLCKLHVTWLCLLMGLCPRLVAWRCEGSALCTCCLVACPRPLSAPAFTFWAPFLRGRPVVGVPLPFVCACAGDPAAVLRSTDGLLTARAGPGRRAAASAGAWLGGASACGLRGGVACGGVCHRGHGEYRAFPLPLL
jgi:hypothetical protein